ncbi:MAG: hypothetical protein JWN48_5090 [Myxococcaceae bacterium]|nr:hypothetical protein [Myxococcaceae bacterium]
MENHSAFRSSWTPSIARGSAARVAVMPGWRAHSTAYRRSAVEKHAPKFAPGIVRSTATSRNFSAVILMRMSVA